METKISNLLEYSASGRFFKMIHGAIIMSIAFSLASTMSVVCQEFPAHHPAVELHTCKNMFKMTSGSRRRQNGGALTVCVVVACHSVIQYDAKDKENLPRDALQSHCASFVWHGTIGPHLSGLSLFFRHFQEMNMKQTL